VFIAHPSPDLYGSDRMLLESVAALVAAGWGVSVALPGDGPLVPMLRRAGAVVRFVPMTVLRRSQLSARGVCALLLDGMRTVGPMARAIRASGADVVLVNTLTIPGCLLAARLARRPAVCHVHEAEDTLSAPVAFALHAPLLLATGVIANSGFAAQRLRAAMPVHRGRIRTVYNGVAGPPVEAAPRDEPGRPPELLLVGRLSPRKGTDVAVAAAALLQQRGTDVRLTLVGEIFPGYETFEQDLRAAAAKLPGTVEFAGFQKDVWPWLAAADIVLVPSRVEPFGNVAVEAALARRPVIASGVQGLPEIVDDGRPGVLVPADDPAAIADAVEDLLSDWPHALAMAEAAEGTARSRFDRKRYAEQFVTALEAAPRRLARTR